MQKTTDNMLFCPSKGRFLLLAGLLIGGLGLFFIGGDGGHSCHAEGLTPMELLMPHGQQSCRPDGQPLHRTTASLLNGKTSLRDQTNVLGEYDFSLEPGAWKLSVVRADDDNPPTETRTITNTEKDLLLTPRTRLVSGQVYDDARERASVTKTFLSELDIVGPDPPIASNQSDVIFQCVAHDTSGQKMAIGPKWRFEPQSAGAAVHSRNGEIITFSPNHDFIGRVRVFLTDSITGRTVEFNASDSLADCDQGLSVFHRLTDDEPGTSVGDRQGFRLIIPDSAIPHGDTAFIFLRKPPVLEVKRNTPRHRATGLIYELCTDDSVSLVRPLELVLPLAYDIQSQTNIIIGRWSNEALDWVGLGGTLSGDEISVEVEAGADLFSQFAVLGISQALAIKDIRLVPNPFSPHDPHGLQLGFTLSTDRSRKPFVTIEVYNMAGELVRTICENEPLPKGCYVPGESLLDSGGRDIARWDGRTDSGEMARNGQYMIRLQATDSGGTAEVMKTVVVIK